MGRRIVLLNVDILRSLVEQDMTWHLHVCSGLSEAATFVHAWYDPTFPQGKLALVYENPAWPETEEGEPYPVFDAKVASVGWRETEAEFKAASPPARAFRPVDYQTNEEL